MKKVVEFENTDIGMFAVFRRPSRKSKAHFSALHQTYELAEAEAIRLMAACAQQDPEHDQLFFIMRLESFVQFSNGEFGNGYASR